MKFGLIRADLATFVVADFPSLKDAEHAIGLPNNVDHGVVGRGLSIVVYGFGMFLPPESTYYAAINRQLIANAAVLYAFDEQGETVNVVNPTVRPPTVAFYGRGANRVESAISAGTLNRPEIKVNGRLIWQWPGKGPAELGLDMVLP